MQQYTVAHTVGSGLISASVRSAEEVAAHEPRAQQVQVARARRALADRVADGLTQAVEEVISSVAVAAAALKTFIGVFAAIIDGNLLTRCHGLRRPDQRLPNLSVAVIRVQSGVVAAASRLLPPQMGGKCYWSLVDHSLPFLQVCLHPEVLHRSERYSVPHHRR